MQFFFESAILALTFGCCFAAAFIVQKAALGFLLRIMARNYKWSHQDGLRMNAAAVRESNSSSDLGPRRRGGGVGKAPQHAVARKLPASSWDLALTSSPSKGEA